MKFQPDSLPGTNVITRQGPGEIWVGATRHTDSLIVPWRGDTLPWSASVPEDLQAAHFDAVLALRPEVVIFGSGPRQRFIAPALLRGLIGAGIGVETMDTAAACRTYNVLASEGRSVVAALLRVPTA